MVKEDYERAARALCEICQITDTITIDEQFDVCESLGKLIQKLKILN